MYIDIIDLTEPCYENLSSVQLAMVRAAQAKKNELRDAASLKVRELFYFMLGNNMARSTAYEKEKEAILAKEEEDQEELLLDLLYRLNYEAIGSEGNENGPYSYPQNPNYSLAYSDRFLVVRQYYMDITSDAQARLQAYGMDTLARSYLGEYYQTLYSLFASYC